MPNTIQPVAFKVAALAWIRGIAGTRLAEEHGIQVQRAEGSLWHIRVIEAGVSENGLTYSPEVLQEAIPIFNGLPVYSYRWGDRLNHKSKAAKRQTPRYRPKYQNAAPWVTTTSGRTANP